MCTLLSSSSWHQTGTKTWVPAFTKTEQYSDVWIRFLDARDLCQTARYNGFVIDPLFGLHTDVRLLHVWMPPQIDLFAPDPTVSRTSGQTVQMTGLLGYPHQWIFNVLRYWWIELRTNCLNPFCSLLFPHVLVRGVYPTYGCKDSQFWNTVSFGIGSASLLRSVTYC